MPEANWLLFKIISLVLIATPGQDMILVMSRSVAQGALAGVVTAAGVSIGLFAGALSGWLRARPTVLAWVYRSSGAILIALGARLALERR